MVLLPAQLVELLALLVFIGVCDSCTRLGYGTVCVDLGQLDRADLL